MTADLRWSVYCGAPGGTRTRDPLIKSQVLLPTELLARIENKISKDIIFALILKNNKALMYSYY